MLNIPLLLASAGSFIVAIAHIVIIFVGANAYRYFGAGEKMAQMAERGSPAPALITAALVCVFALWGYYPLTAMGFSKPLPLLRPALIVIGCIYTLRGLLVVVELAARMNVFTFRDGVRPQDPWFSAASLAVGICYLWGVWLMSNR
jgi:hypothetical protein